MSKAEKIIDRIQKFSGNKLGLSDELEHVIDISYKRKKIELLKDVAFTAKYLNGLERVMQSNISFSNLSTNGTDRINKEQEDKVTEDAMERIKSEYRENFSKLTSQLESLFNDMDEDEKGFYRNKYLSLTQSSLNHLRDLIKDLTVMKNFINEYPAAL